MAGFQSLLIAMAVIAVITLLTVLALPRAEGYDRPLASPPPAPGAAD
jgi:hypothetical protein